MKVTGIKTFICHAYRTNWVFVKVLTDEGITGVGEATLEYREPTVVQLSKNSKDIWWEKIRTISKNFGTGYTATHIGAAESF